MSVTKKCRRCTECKESEHHWIPDSRFGDGSTRGEHEWVCKHCPARGDECDVCEGYGVTDLHNINAWCIACKGEGVCLCGHAKRAT